MDKKQMHQEKICFTKMHGLGNDFVIINALTRPYASSHLPIQQLADRHIGIGFDQLLIIEPSLHADFFCRIYNADGSEAEQCGNGLRCVARFIYEENLIDSQEFRLETKAGIYPLEIKDYDHIRVSMGVPVIRNNLIELHLNEEINTISVSILSVGNPHAIIKVQSLEMIHADKLGPEISSHSCFPDGTNVGFMQIISPEHIRLRTYERGAGETFACGSNACAAAVAGIVNGWLGSRVNVEFHYGSLEIEWEGKNQAIHMTGPAARVYSGEIEKKLGRKPPGFS
jgi:diaminopimelate epimerase